jgi:HSP20 family protein
MSEILGFDPFAELASYREALRQLRENGLPLPRDLMPAAMASVMVPLDIIDNGPDIVVQANLPGAKPDEVSITVTGSTLTIKGSLENSQKFDGGTYLRRERRASAFMRSVSLPVAVDSDRAEAHFRNGVLTLTLPKSESVRPRTIKVVTDQPA